MLEYAKRDAEFTRAVYESYLKAGFTEEQALELVKVNLLDGLLVHITAMGHDGVDCVSRSFAPKLGISEDPVCGSAHCHIVPYWSGALGRKDIKAYQASERGGYLYCSYEGERVIISGRAALYSRSEILEDA